MVKKNNKTLKEIFAGAVANYNNKDLVTAEAMCNKILNIDPNHFDSLLLTANISGSNRNYKRAKELLIKASEIQPKNTTVFNNLGSACKELGELENAQAFYEKTLTLNPNHTHANFNLGLLYYQLKQINKAKNLLEKTTQIQPNFALAHFNLGNLLAETKQYKKAKESFSKAIKIRPDLYGAHNNLGLTFRSLGDYESAINCYKEAIKIRPNHAGAHSNLGRAYTELGEFKKAINALNAAIKLEPKNLYNYYYLSELKKDFLDTKLLNKIKQIVKSENQTKRNLAYGNFLLASHERNKKNYKEEFNYLIKAHDNFFKIKEEIFRLGVKYCFEDLLQIVNSAHLSEAEENKETKIAPIFIIGVPRCGSTLIEKIIGSGKELITMGEETAVLENFINNKILSRQSLNLGDVTEVRNDLINAYKEKGLFKNEKELIFTDKSLNNFFYLEIIKKIFPNAKIINCRRNIISSIMSIFQNNLTELAWAHDLKNIFKYCDNYFTIMKKFKAKYPTFIYDLEFEKFTSNPEEESKKLMKFCKLTWDKKCLSFYKRKDIISKTTSYQQIRKAIYQHPSDRYLPYKIFLKDYGSEYPWFE